ncbi:MAG: hypothetical protein IPK22_01015 [Verrucomicrobiaceae bacterium]|nr:hypothetical protein [Verrucomicrobiaceae bacterium]
MKTVSRGEMAFSHQLGNVTVSGHSLSQSETDEALEHSVIPLLKDDSGAGEIERLLTSLATTEFATDHLRAALTDDRMLPDWQVGEALAEAYLQDHHDCEFPWPMSRDARNPRGSLPGTDSVGFQEHDGSYRMAFGETKTSNDKNRPPQVWSGRSGLKKQLEGLRDSTEIKGHIVVRYLGIRANGATWKATYMAAAGRYLANPTDVALFGVLIRDTAPHEDDALGRAKALASGCPPDTFIEIVVLYLPKNQIAALSSRVTSIEGRRKK